MSNEDIVTYCANIKSGDHISCIYRTKEELLGLLIPFLTIGLKNNNKCIFVLGEYSSSEIVNTFREAGFDLSPYISKQQFVFFRTEEVYLKDNVFDKEFMLSSVEGLQSAAVSQGYKGLQITGSALWLLEHTPVISEFMKYEASVNKILQNCGIIALCQYDESKFDARILIDVLRTHPTVYLHDHILTNKYFTPSDEFTPFADIHANADMYKQMIHSIST